MLQWQGISILYRAPRQEILLWYFTKEDKCQFVLPDPLFVHQSGESMTSKVLSEEGAQGKKKKKDMSEWRGAAGLSNLYKTLFV